MYSGYGTSAIAATKQIKQRHGELPGWIDSDGVNGGLSTWRHNGWRTSSGVEVSNQDLWQQLALVLDHRRGKLQCEYIRGHIWGGGVKGPTNLQR